MNRKIFLIGGRNVYSNRLIAILQRKELDHEIITTEKLKDKQYYEVGGRFVLISFGASASSAFQFVRQYWGGLYIEEFCIEMGCQAEVMNFPSSGQLEYIKTEFKSLKNTFSDSISKNILERILRYWQSGDRNTLKCFKNLEKNIYFNEPFFEQKCGHVYYDVGAYTGDSLRLFRQFFPNYHSSVLFEPNIFLTPEKGLLTERDLYLHVACSDKAANGCLSLEGVNSTLSETAKRNSIFVKITTLDRISKLMAASPTFIKIDAEGFDIKVLRGATDICQTTKPVLAVSVYHDPLHIIEGVRFLISAGYEGIYLRKYCDYNAETVLYGVHERGRYH